jgi:hypothetical protein
MPHEEPIRPLEQTGEQPALDTATQVRGPAGAYAPDAYATGDDASAYEAGEAWLEEPELPRRPRRRLLGTGANPIALALLAALLAACGFIGGVLVEKGQTSSASSPTGGGAAAFASRLRGLGGSSSTGTSSTGASSSAAAGLPSGFTRPTAGTVAYLEGSTLYVTNSEGNTVKVSTSAGTTVNKTISSSVKGIHPGETVTVTGSTGANGAVSAETIDVGGSGGGLASLFGGGGTGKTGGGSAAGGKEPSLFGNGG